ncbi:MAG: AzlC family ABC transporter permease [Solirubrobacterales bacterium]
MREGMRAAAPLALPTFALGVAFGVVAKPVMGPAAPIVMSVLVFSGAAQFAALSVLAGGGGAAAAIAAGTLMNARWVAMGVAIAPSLRGNALVRGLRAQAIVDASFAIGSRGDGSFDPDRIVGATIPQAGSWVLGTVAGVCWGSLLGDPAALGLDAIFPAFYLALLAGETERHRDMGRRWPAPLAAAIGGAIALAAMPFAPPGIPVVAAAGAALIGLRER